MVKNQGQPVGQSCLGTEELSPTGQKEVNRGNHNLMSLKVELSLGKLSGETPVLANTFIAAWEMSQIRGLR